MTYQNIELERRGHVAILRLNRPEKMNAISMDMTADVHAALDELEGAFPDIRAVVLTGAGRGFCSGADLQVVAANVDGKKTNPIPGRYIIDIAPRLRAIPQPVIGAINGVAAGAGLGVACACDFRLAAEEARFSCLYVKRSIVPDTGASFTLQRLVGPGIAAEMAFTGRMYDSAFAREHGLVNRVLPAAQLMPEVMALAEDIAANPPLAVRAIKKLMDGHHLALTAAVDAETAANKTTEGTADRREAAMAFIEKRKPVFYGR